MLVDGAMFVCCSKDCIVHDGVCLCSRLRCQWHQESRKVVRIKNIDLEVVPVDERLPWGGMWDSRVLEL